MKRLSPFVFLIALVSALVVYTRPAQVQQTANAADRFEVSDVMIPMRDGVRLSTKIFTSKNQAGPLPIILKRTPYGIAGSAGNFNAYFKALADEGYIFVFQDLRGKFGSEGTFVMQRPPRGENDTASLDEGTDTWDTIDWLLKNVRGNNGRVGMLGVSYDGWTTIMGALQPHPALKAVSPQASPADMWLGDDFHHNGAFRLSYGFEYAAMMESGKDVQQFTFDRLRHVRVVSSPRSALERKREVLAREDSHLERLRRPPRLRRILETPDDGSTPDRREGADAERRRLVGPGGFLRPGAHLRRAREVRQPASQLPGCRPVATWRMGERHGRVAWLDSVRQRHVGVLQRPGAGAVLRALPQGQGTARLSGSPHLRVRS